MMRLPQRRSGPPPHSSRTLPCRQLDQWPPAEIHRRLVEECLRLPNVRCRQSRMAPPDAQALFVPDHLAGGPREAYIDQHEFCHLHPPPDGTIHLTLPHPFHQSIVDLGWAECHPLSRNGVLPRLVTVYSPRDMEELEVVLELVVHSLSFATGLVTELPLIAMA
jgi:Luciferase